MQWRQRRYYLRLGQWGYPRLPLLQRWRIIWQLVHLHKAERGHLRHQGQGQSQLRDARPVGHHHPARRDHLHDLSHQCKVQRRRGRHHSRDGQRRHGRLPIFRKWRPRQQQLLYGLESEQLFRQGERRQRLRDARPVGHRDAA